MQSLLTQEYFEDLDPIQLNKYVTSNTFDTSQPYQGQRYSESIVKQKKEIACKQIIENNVSKKWREYFGKDYKEIVFQETIECGFMVINRLLEIHLGEKFDIKDIKQMLIKEYLFFKDKNFYEILSAQGKTAIIKEMKKGGIDFDILINSEHYYVTNIDIWLIANRYEIPVIFISSTNLIENNQPLLVTQKSDHYYFVQPSGARKEGYPRYRIITDPKNNIKLPISLLNKKMKALITESTLPSLPNFIDTFVKPKRKPKLVVKDPAKTKLVVK